VEHDRGRRTRLLSIAGVLDHIVQLAGAQGENLMRSGT
jgi:hypothetical protein